jgi:hypothetical protein
MLQAGALASLSHRRLGTAQPVMKDLTMKRGHGSNQKGPEGMERGQYRNSASAGPA